MTEKNQLLRQLPAVERILNEPLLLELAEDCPRTLILEAAQQAVAQLRQQILTSPPDGLQMDLSPAAAAKIAARLAQAKETPSLRPVINATGTLLHTNFGRAPLSDTALSAVSAVSQSYSNLEFDLETGQRGHRYSHVEEILCRLTGAEAAAVVNNNAAAVLLALSALGKGTEGIVSRGELVEIGGAFRVPDVMAASGMTLVEVGTTNNTHMRDYEEAITENTGMLLKIHTSNFRIVGFTASVPAAELVPLGRKHGIPVMEDLGSGMLFDLSPFGLPQEPTVAEAVASGIDVVTFSGDKLLGGPQAGLIVGKKEPLAKIRSHPLARALRIDKMTLAALEATLRSYLDREKAMKEIPVLQMLGLGQAEILDRCHALEELIRNALSDRLDTEIVPETSQVGGGALPTTELPGHALALAPKNVSADELATRLRHTDPPLVGRIQEDRLLINPRTIPPDENQALVRVLEHALNPRDDR